MRAPAAALESLRTPSLNRIGPAMELITDAAGGSGTVRGHVVELLLDTGESARAMVRRDDERAARLRAPGAEVVVGDLINANDMVYAMAEVCAAASERGALV